MTLRQLIADWEYRARQARDAIHHDELERAGIHLCRAAMYLKLAKELQTVLEQHDLWEDTGSGWRPVGDRDD